MDEWADLLARARRSGSWRGGSVRAWSVPEMYALVSRLGQQPELWRDAVVQLPGARWYQRLHVDPDLEVWLLTWARDTATELHDHGGSIGAFQVVAGSLTEERFEGSRIRRRRLRAGQGAAFDADHVHDVINIEPIPAISLHAYSPPLQTMTYYAVGDDRIRPVRTVAVDDRVPA